MTADVSTALSLLEQFKVAVGKDDVDSSKKLLNALKKSIHPPTYMRGSHDDHNDLQIELTKFPAVSQNNYSSPNASQQLSIARDILELAVLFSARQGDDASFDRHFAQLRPFYLDARSMVPPSQQEPLLSGLHLLSLLVQSRIAEFHTALELLPDSILNTPEVSQIMQLEAWLMEGAYNKVLAARTASASPYYLPLMERLEGTVRDEIAGCCSAAYISLSTQEAIKILRLNGEMELSSYVAERGWKLEHGRVVFSDNADGSGVPGEGPPAQDIVQHCLEYAKELERIV